MRAKVIRDCCDNNCAAWTLPVKRSASSRFSLRLSANDSGEPFLISESFESGMSHSHSATTAYLRQHEPRPLAMVRCAVRNSGPQRYACSRPWYKRGRPRGSTRTPCSGLGRSPDLGEREATERERAVTAGDVPSAGKPRPSLARGGGTVQLRQAAHI